MTWHRLELDNRDLDAGYEAWSRERTFPLGAVLAIALGVLWVLAVVQWAVAP